MEQSNSEAGREHFGIAFQSLCILFRNVHEAREASIYGSLQVVVINSIIELLGIPMQCRSNA